MIEIRPIVREEAETFLELLCDIFSLNLAQAKQIFFTEPTFDLGRKWALFENGNMASILTTTPLVFGWGRAVGIAGVGTHVDYRGRGLAKKLLDESLRESKINGEGAAMLFAHDAKLYQDCGFEIADRVVKYEVKGTHHMVEGDPLEPEEVRALYNEWAAVDSARLRRDEKRWDAWTWTLKHCEGFGSGYVCVEPVLLREAVLAPNLDVWPVPFNTIWYGMEGLTKDLAVPGTPLSAPELLVMTHSFPEPPKMFMTDQF